MGEEGIGDSANRPLPAVFRLIERDFVIHSIRSRTYSNGGWEKKSEAGCFSLNKNLGGNGYVGTRAALCGLQRAERTMQPIEGNVLPQGITHLATRNDCVW